MQTLLSGLFAFAGGIAVGWSFDRGPGGATAALVVLALTACAAAACARSQPGQAIDTRDAAQAAGGVEQERP
ncbi:hypothetical protein ABZ907_12270 [Nonomuraea wenchangensis]